VLAPTRELAQQIEKVMRALGDYLQVRLTCAMDVYHLVSVGSL
jgi:superfamily II DNA/RNA helicase